MAVEVLGLPESFEIANTQAMVGDAAREISLSGQNNPEQSFPEIPFDVAVVVVASAVVVAGLVVFIRQQRPWQRK
ncbi:MAG: hypothetical protein KIH63_005245 [Candidatus Saccharibacteria bacterium]|nr:hypothetical protein [Candidatus Saccharibacteria bacterium]